MVEPENKMFYQLDNLTSQSGEQQRLKALSVLGLLEAQTIPIFEEATQTAAHFLDSPICILGFLDQNCLRVRSAVGLSRIGLMNQLAATRSLPRHEAFCTHVVESHQVLAIDDALNHPDFSKSILVQHYGIRAYLGAPLVDAFGSCLGAIAVMERSPRNFTNREMDFLELMARWSMSEFERNRLLELQEFPLLPPTPLYSSSALPLCSKTSSVSPNPLAINQLKLELLMQLTHELRTPLTSVLGMATVVGREIYGPLTSKQKEYLEIIQDSGRYLLSLVNEISELGSINDSTTALNLTAVDIEMLSQQVINTLEEVAKRREQELRLSMEPGLTRTWVLDKDKVRQLLYHLVFSVIHACGNGSVVRIHVSHKSDGLTLTVSVSHPWLGDGLIQVDPTCSQLVVPSYSDYLEAASDNTYQKQPEPPVLSVLDSQALKSSLSDSDPLGASADKDVAQLNSLNRSPESLRLLLSNDLSTLR